MNISCRDSGYLWMVKFVYDGSNSTNIYSWATLSINTWQPSKQPTGLKNPPAPFDLNRDVCCRIYRLLISDQDLPEKGANFAPPPFPLINFMHQKQGITIARGMGGALAAPLPLIHLGGDMNLPPHPTVRFWVRDIKYL